MQLQFDCAVVPVSGAAAGIGLAICERLKSAGAVPILLDNNRDNLEKASRQIYPELTDHTKHAHVIDVRDRVGIDACFDRIGHDHRRLDHAVANAGILLDAGVLEITDEQWHSVIDVNLTGTMYFCRAAARHLVEAGTGSIVTMASVAGFGSRERKLPYSSSKAAIINMTRALALDLGRLGVRVNGIAPGPIDTAMQAHKSDAMRQGSIERTALGRSGSPDEIAKVALFLMSDLASYVTGQTIVVDGGMTTRYN